ncbi:BTB/POZ domain-containing protein 19 isoform X1 [Homo sapiens]|uniref:BTB/POZ domain-containing protein 19 isoform X1 n=1 Tax=Homo sapiens TaxID=9606 RepID=UPI0005D01651|nr:BTB/POZ domain-containing protein 19 isoform X1 [Homo sapiens]XP_054190635.1 BTB/POZ domain-containing protein 19 isoform X1 [Homo sapiens]|eukprot:XP_011539105.1 BTB/POZ domain-containing protein 19 isoform X2 [Homo sapiens]
MEPLGLVVHGKAEPFSAALRSLVNNPRYSDVCFVVGQERQEVFAHRCLLACRCNFFQRLLGTEPGPGVPSPVVLSTVPTEAFLAVLEFLYTNSVKLYRHSVSLLTRGLGGRGGGCQRQEFAHYTVGTGQGKLPSTPPTTHSTGAGSADSGCGVWAGGTERGGFLCQVPVSFPLLLTGSLPALPHTHSGLERNVCPHREKYVYLSQLCLQFVVKVLDVDLVCEALQVAVTFGLGQLQERCVAFIEAHSQEALRTRGFLELSAAALLPLLRSDKLCVDEAELVRAARSWARVGAAVLERPVAEVAAPVVKELRLALLAPAELSALEEQNRQEPLIPVGTRGTGPAPLSRGWSRLWRRGNAMPCGEGMRPGAPRVAAGEAPCPGSITAFWTCPSNDPTPGLAGSPRPAQLSLPQTTAPEVLGVRSGLPFPACPVSRAPEEPLSATRSPLCGIKPVWARWGRAGQGLGWASLRG